MTIRFTAQFIFAFIALAVLELSTPLQAAASGKPQSPARVSQPSKPFLALAPCQVPGVKGEARCGTYSVYEDREAKKGRKLELKVVVLPALNPKPEPDALVYLQGGPGLAATESAAAVAQIFADARQNRDILLVDQRGTGRANGLNCDLLGNDNDPQSYLGEFLPLDAVRTCRDELSKRADLRLYTTPLAMDDLDDVRAALGYEKLNLVGSSYGTRAAQVYLARHPAHVRTVVLQGPTTTDAKLPSEYAKDAQHALDLLFQDCNADPSCHDAFPNLRAEFQTVIERLRSKPTNATVMHPRTRTPVHVEISLDAFTETVRNLLYRTETASRLPLLIHMASGNNFDTFGTFSIGYTRSLGALLSMGMWMSIVSAEDSPFVDLKQAAKIAEGTFYGDYRVRRQVQASAIWPRGKLPKDYFQPVRSDVPVLILSGELDPITPPRWAQRAARRLTNSLVVPLRYSSHAPDNLSPCSENVLEAFVAAGSVKGLNVSCFANARRPPFIISPNELLPRRNPARN